jgi:hypothetical protein
MKSDGNNNKNVRFEKVEMWDTVPLKFEECVGCIP